MRFCYNSKKISIPIIIVLLSTEYLSQILNLFVILLLALYFFSRRNFKINLEIPGKKMYFLFLAWALALGLVYHQSQLYIIFKQSYYFILLFLYWYIGCQIIKTKKVRREVLFYSLYVVAMFVSVQDLISSGFTIVQSGIGDINSYRMAIGTGNTFALIGAYILMFYNDELKLQKSKLNISLLICFLSVFIHFSRMSILKFIILLLFSGIRLINLKWLKYIICFVAILTSVFAAFPELANAFITKLLNAGTEIKFNANWDSYSIVQNWRGYEVACAIKQFKGASIFQQLFGGGFGTTLNVGNYAYLVTSDDSLCFLHNGYFTQLLIWGVFGVVSFFIWIFSFFKKAKHFLIKKDAAFIRGLVVCIIVSTYFVMGPFFSKSEASMFFVFALLFTENKISVSRLN